MFTTGSKLFLGGTVLSLATGWVIRSSIKDSVETTIQDLIRIAGGREVDRTYGWDRAEWERVSGLARQLVQAGERVVDLLDDLGLTAGVFTENEKNSLNHDSDGDEGKQQNRPHDFLAHNEKVHRGGVTEEKREREALSNHRMKM